MNRWKTLASAAFLLLASPGHAEEEGRSAFERLGCGTCHGVTAAGIAAKVRKGPLAGPDLSGGAARIDGPLAPYLKRERKLEGKAHPKPFTGAEDDLAALDAWLRSLRAP